jgi:hypothetical protein
MCLFTVRQQHRWCFCNGSARPLPLSHLTWGSSWRPVLTVGCNITYKVFAFLPQCVCLTLVSSFFFLFVFPFLSLCHFCTHFPAGHTSTPFYVFIDEIYLLTDVDIPSDRNVIQKEAEKKWKYKNLSIEIQGMWNMKCFVIPVIIGPTGILTKRRKIAGNSTRKACSRFCTRKQLY